MRSFAAVVLVCLASQFAEAAVVVLANSTQEPLTVSVTLGSAAPQNVTIAVGESKPMHCGKVIQVTFKNEEGLHTLKLDPWMAYMFITKKKIGTDLLAIDLAGKSPGDADIPDVVPAAKTLRVPVKMLVDDADRRTKFIWSAALKKRLAAANEVTLGAAGVTFELVETEEWTSDPAFTDLKNIYTEFEKQVKPEPAALAIGYTSRAAAVIAGKPTAALDFAFNRPALTPFLLIREGEPKSEPERLEVLVSQLGRFLGAVGSPDQYSCMRSKLGDGKALLTKFHIGFDPLNTLAINIWADAMRAGTIRKLDDIKPEMLVRLARVYATLNAAMPEEPLTEQYQALLQKAVVAGAGIAPGAVPMPPPKVVEVPKGDATKVAGVALSPQNEATRKVVKAIVVQAEENIRKPVNNGRIKGDDLTTLYIRTAADVAYNLEPKLRKQAFLYGLGIGLDDSMIMRDKPIMGDICKAVESDDERKARLIVLGNPTMRYRRDSCQHFVISAALTEFGGAMIAEQVGLIKEQKDMQGASGFSFADLCADFAGIELANTVKAGGESLNTLRQKFTVADYMPKLDDLPDGLSKEKFKLHYGDTGDARFKAEYESVKKRVKDLPVHAKK
ncbi:hypothetical protein BH11PLA2_BH11PLA2_23860 [soil metagenome]